MSLHAIDDIGDALSMTRDFLLPVGRRRWLRLALVVFFVGSPAANLGGLRSNVGGPPDSEPPPGTPGPPVLDVPFSPGAVEVGPLVLAVLAAALVVGLAFAFVGSVMEFVLVESLRRRTVRLRAYWDRRWRQGLRLFVFRLVLSLVVLASVAVLVAPFLLALVGVPDAGLAGLGVAALLVVPALVVLATLAALVDGFTTVFVVPVMICDDCGVLAGWRRLLGTVPDAWIEYLVYAVASVLLSFVGGLLVGLVVALLALLLLVPFAVPFGVGAGIFAFVSEPLGVAVLVVVGVAFALAVLVVAALVQVPVTTYLRYYALLVLGDVEPRLDLIPDQRAAVRSSNGNGRAGATA